MQVVHNYKIMILISVIVGIFGLIVGSFLTSLVYRLSDLESLVKGRSQCPNCKAKLGFWDLIPLLSFVFLVGKCRYCKKRISRQYPVIELITATLFVLTYINFGLTFYSLLLVIVFSGLIAIAFYDLKTMIIPDEIIIPLSIISVIYFIGGVFRHHTIYPLVYALAGAMIFGGIIGLIYLISKGKWMGFGDIKLAALLGFILGLNSVFIGFLLTFLIGGLIGIILIAFGKKGLKDKIPFAPILILGFIIAIFWGEKIINWYFEIGF